MRLSIRIRSARTQAGLSQSKLAEQLGVTRAAVANWESATDAVAPSTERLADLAAATRVSFEWLATGRGARGFDQAPTTTETEQPLNPTELRLLRAFRNCKPALRESILVMAEGASGSDRRR